MTMIKPSKYKSISTTDLKSKPVVALNITEKSKANTILNKLMQLIKLKHT
jgi:hypothetical protein